MKCKKESQRKASPTHEKALKHSHLIGLNSLMYFNPNGCLKCDFPFFIQNAKKQEIHFKCICVGLNITKLTVRAAKAFRVALHFVTKRWACQLCAIQFAFNSYLLFNVFFHWYQVEEKTDFHFPLVQVKHAQIQCFVDSFSNLFLIFFISKMELGVMENKPAEIALAI